MKTSVKIYNYKIINLTEHEMKWLKHDLRYFIKHGVKCTFRKDTAWIHMPEDKLYSVVTARLARYNWAGKLAYGNTDILF